MPIANISPQNRRIFGFIILAVALCLLVLPYAFFPQFFIPKENASMGYVAPASIEGWALMGSGLALLVVSVVLIKTAQSNN